MPKRVPLSGSRFELLEHLVLEHDRPDLRDWIAHKPQRAIVFIHNHAHSADARTDPGHDH